MLVLGGTTACQALPTLRGRPAASAPAVATPVPPLARIPRNASRFEIEAIDDSTARFKPREASWVREGMTAYVVDPLHRDALVARLRVVSVWNDMAVAVVTSQVTRVTTDHVVLMVPAPAPWWHAHPFWTGSMAGGLLGLLLGIAAAS